MNFFDKLTTLIRARGSLEDLGVGLARAFDYGHLRGFVLFGGQERCLVTVPFRPRDVRGRLRQDFERSDWQGRPRDALQGAFTSLEVPTGEIGEGILWSFLGSAEQPLGVFALVRDPDPRPSEAEVRETQFFFQLASELARGGSQPARRQRESDERDHLLAALNQVGRLMLSRPDPARLLPSLLKIALDAARTEVGSILLLSEGRFSSEVEWGLPGELVQGIRFLPEDRGLIERVAATLEPVIIDDFSGPEIRLPPGFPVRIQSLVAIPLLAGNRLTGILNLATGEEGRELLLSTVTALATLAGLMATAVENARLAETLCARVEEATLGRVEEQNLLRQVLETLPSGVLISDSSGRIVAANPVAEEMLGLGGKGGSRYPDRNVVTLRPFFSWLRGRFQANREREELEYRLPSGQRALLKLSISPLRQPSGRGGHVTVIVEAPSGESEGLEGSNVESQKSKVS